MTKNMHFFWKFASAALTAAAERERIVHPTKPVNKGLTIAKIVAMFMANKK